MQREHRTINHGVTQFTATTVFVDVEIRYDLAGFACKPGLQLELDKAISKPRWSLESKQSRILSKLGTLGISIYIKKLQFLPGKLG